MPTKRRARKTRKPQVRYSRALAEKVCRRVAAGKTLLEVCQADPRLPSRDTFYTWLLKDKRLAETYRQARLSLVEHWVDEMVKISDDHSGDTREVKDDEGNVLRVIEVPNRAARARLQVDTRKWLAARLASSTYGDKLELDHNMTGFSEALARAVAEERKPRRD